MSDDPAITELLAVLDRNPELLPLRVSVIELLLSNGRHTEALSHCATALAQDPHHAQATALLARCTAALTGAATPSPVSASPAAVTTPPVAGGAAPGTTPPGTEFAGEEADVPPGADRNPPAQRGAGYDWDKAEEQVGDIIAPSFVNEQPVLYAEGDVGLFERPKLTLADVGGMDAVKRQLELSLLGPIRNPELAKAFGTSARGGLLLYGPPGCGKTFLASAVAGELGANFYAIDIADILDLYVGRSEKNLQQVFQTARRKAPCVLFFDEIDALGHKRSQLSNSSSMRTTVNQLLTEMDSMTSDNEGVYVIGATNHPWDVDVALRRPGRFDHMILVTLPDAEARASILRHHLRDRPVAGIDLNALAARTDGLSGADLAHVCKSATQFAMADSIRSGTVRPVTMADMQQALSQIRPSTGAWFESARNVVEFANNDGTYDELATYMRQRNMR
ncbi:AAA family ATPase [Nocardia yamanashiensis]|uniref:ATP-binding protein n=1 Tax=Nocardia yamanashiensis TaxID=209247 RepID=UPI001E387BF6|nr:ATP-binding protein [Nocardia yamanashiensis]UGT40220.1 AAA family ATPase [Nocardia yamanashiensis]